MAESATTTRAIAASTTSTNGFLVRASFALPALNQSPAGQNWDFSVQGNTSRVQDWMGFADALAQPVRPGWKAEGGLSVRLHASEKSASAGSAARPTWQLSLDSRDLAVTSSFVNQPLEFPACHVEFTPAQRTVTLASASAFGATWSGTMVRKIADPAWSFDLQADTLDAAEMDRWLGPRARPGLLARLTGHGGEIPAGVAPEAELTGLSARGRLRIQEIKLAPLRASNFDGDVRVDGRNITVRKGQAEFAGGKLSGTFSAELSHSPAYQFQGNFDRVDLAELGNDLSSFQERLAGTASAAVSLNAHGIGRENLVTSLQGEATLNAQNARWDALTLSQAVPTTGEDRAPTPLDSVQGKFRIADAAISLAGVILNSAHRRYQADGRVTFTRSLDIRIMPIDEVGKSLSVASATAAPGISLQGTLQAPSIVFLEPAIKAAVRSSARVR